MINRSARNESIVLLERHFSINLVESHSMKAVLVESVSDIISLPTKRVQKRRLSRMTIVLGAVDVPTRDLLPHSCNRSLKPQYSLRLEGRSANRSPVIMAK